MTYYTRERTAGRGSVLQSYPVEPISENLLCEYFATFRAHCFSDPLDGALVERLDAFS